MANLSVAEGLSGARGVQMPAVGPLEKRGFLPGETIGVGAYAKVKLARSIHTNRKVIMTSRAVFCAVLTHCRHC